MRAAQTCRGIVPLLVRLDKERGQAGNRELRGSADRSMMKLRVAHLCEKFWNGLPVALKPKTLRSREAWCVPASVWAASSNRW